MTIAQDTSETPINDKDLLSGFVRGGFYSWTDPIDDKIYVSSAFSDFGLKLETADESFFKAFADVRFRYGSEFQKPVSRFDLREAYVGINGQKWDLSVGQKIIKWGRCDFTNPTSKLSPQNMISRSPDREDMNMANLLASFGLHPSSFMDIRAVVIPYYRSSVLIIDPVPLPEYVTIKQIDAIITDKEMISYGLKADFHLRGLDMALSWFDGYDPMPGIELSEFSMDFTQLLPVISAGLNVRPYKIRMFGLDFETALNAVCLRGEAAWTKPYPDHQTREYVPMPEIKWVAGIDWTSGIWRFTGEYSGKYVGDFYSITADSFIGAEPDFSKIAAMLEIPGFDISEYFKQQVGAFNRLYNYQMKEFAHSAGLKTEGEFAYGRLLPSVTALYNFSYRDLMIMPEIKAKPRDGLTITAGAEIYTGRKNSLYDLIDDFMNGVYVSLRIDF
ncbi:MAG: hypothetical protein GYA41_04695 [Bacteroidales bacterium]|nr:hypothetical protein [Bacteroidales bacterium]